MRVYVRTGVQSAMEKHKEKPLNYSLCQSSKFNLSHAKMKKNPGDVFSLSRVQLHRYTYIHTCAASIPVRGSELWGEGKKSLDV